MIERAHANGALVACRRRPARAHAARRRRARWAPTSSSARRSASACRSASAARTPAYPRDARRVQAHAARAARRRVGRRRGPHRVPARAADARAAHPPREGDEQHLHRAGAARGDRRSVRGRTTAPTACARSRARVHRLTATLARGLARRRRRGRARRLLRHAHGARARAAADEIAAAARPRRINLRVVDADTLGIALDETTTPEIVDGGAAPRSASTVVGRRRGTRRRDPGRAARARREFLTHPVFHAHHSEHQMLRYLRAARRPRPRARPHDDPARLVHDEAQRDRRDGAGHVARVRAASIRSRRSSRRGLPRAVRRPRALARRDHRLRRGVAAAERRLAGRVRGPARDPQVPRVARRDARATCA